MAVGTGHCSCVGGSVNTRRPRQRSQVGATVGSDSQVGWRTRSWLERDLGTNDSVFLGEIQHQLHLQTRQERKLHRAGV